MSDLRPPAQWELKYLETLAALRSLANGRDHRPDRTNTGTFGLFGKELRVGLKPGELPVLVSKAVHLPSVIHELLWFIRGETNIAYLRENGVKIWDEWADDNGDLGPVYGAQWRGWAGNGERVDQLKIMVQTLMHDPFSRRNIVSAWRPDLLPISGHAPREQAKFGRQALPPCHMLFQAYAEELSIADRILLAYQNGQISHDVRDELQTMLAASGADTQSTLSNMLSSMGVPALGLSLRVDQRSADWFLGVPFNVTSYALLTHLLARCVGMYPREVVFHFGDYHLYSNHLEAAGKQLEGWRDAGYNPQKLWDTKVPTLSLEAALPGAPYDDPDRAISWLENIEASEIVLGEYSHLGKISAPVAV